MTEAAQYHVARLGVLKNDRSNFNEQWEEASRLLIPGYSGTFNGVNNGARQQGQKNTELQFDSTAAFAAQRFSSVMESLVTPQNTFWEILKSSDRLLQKNRQVRIFFDELGETLHDYRYRAAANFVGNSQSTYLGLGVYGNGVLYVDKPEDGKGLRYRNCHLGETYFVPNHAGIVDTMYRDFTLTAQQIVTQYGAENCPEFIRDAVKNPNQKDRKFEILHVTCPRAEYDGRRMDDKGLPFASLHFLIETKDILRESGFWTFPYATARYTQLSGEWYGRGPAQWILPSIKLLNEQKKVAIRQGHKATDPVLLTYDDGQLGTLSLRAGAVNPGGVNKDGRPLVHALPTGNMIISEKHMEVEKNVIHDAFLITLFQILIDTPQMTATEVMERAREKGILLAPTAGRLQSEFLGTLIEREIDLLMRQGLLPKMPPILAQAAAEYRIEYDNPLSRMARAEKVAGFMRTLDTAANYAKLTGDMEPLDHLNFDDAMPEIMDIQGAPARWTRTPEQIAQRRQGRAEQAQTQQMIEAAPAVASVAKTATAA